MQGLRVVYLFSGGFQRLVCDGVVVSMFSLWWMGDGG